MPTARVRRFISTPPVTPPRPAAGGGGSAARPGRVPPDARGGGASRPRPSRPLPPGRRLRSASRAHARVRSLRAVQRASIALDDAVAAASTGDIWLFRRRSFPDLAIRTLTTAPVNHGGMVGAIDAPPPLLWHAELGRSLPDVWTGERQRGVQLHKLRDAVTTWDERYGQRAFVRQL